MPIDPDLRRLALSGVLVDAARRAAALATRSGAPVAVPDVADLAAPCVEVVGDLPETEVLPVDASTEPAAPIDAALVRAPVAVRRDRMRHPGRLAAADRLAGRVPAGLR